MFLFLCSVEVEVLFIEFQNDLYASVEFDGFDKLSLLRESDAEIKMMSLAYLVVALSSVDGSENVAII